MRLVWLLLALGLAPAGCGTDTSCGAVCAKAQACGALPGALGGSVSDCTAKCATSTRGTEGVRACIADEHCPDIQFGRCGAW
jgi:hypothetical protein